MPHYILDGILLGENEGTSIRSILVSGSAVLGVQDLVFVSCLDPSASLVLCVPSIAGSDPVNLHCYQELVDDA